MTYPIILNWEDVIGYNFRIANTFKFNHGLAFSIQISLSYVVVHDSVVGDYDVDFSVFQVMIEDIDMVSDNVAVGLAGLGY